MNIYVYIYIYCLLNIAYCLFPTYRASVCDSETESLLSYCSPVPGDQALGSKSG